MKDMSKKKKIGTVLITVGFTFIALIVIISLFMLHWIAGCAGISIFMIIIGSLLV